MTERLYRAQLLLEPKQHYELRRRAEAEGRSISDVAREVIQLGLDQSESSGETRQQLIARLSERRNEIYKTSGVYRGEPLAESRAARIAQLAATQEEVDKAGGDS
jgi:hypothetical protein